MQFQAQRRRCCLQAASSVLYTTSCKHSLVFLRMSEIIARNMLSRLKLLIKLLLLYLVGRLFYCTNDVRSNKHKKGVYPSLKCTEFVNAYFLILPPVLISILFHTGTSFPYKKSTNVSKFCTSHFHGVFSHLLE